MQLSPFSIHTDIINPISPPSYYEDGGGGDTGSCNKISESVVDLDEFHSDDSFSSAPSLMANGLVSTWKISMLAQLSTRIYQKKANHFVL
ncbi:hypothetical protein LIER_03647 [Lithospermum erythrorhizon]|uniref:Uncharacterized protein n=1 Tax=Lithospermum erythrorhizon TaxID=34254 RepID=A0AAV3NUB6_LITER